MIPGLLRSNKVAAIAAASVLLIVIFLGLAAHRDSWDVPYVSDAAAGFLGGSSDKKPSSPFGSDNLAEIRQFYIEQIMKPTVKIDAKTYRPFGAFEYKLPDKVKPKWTEPMGKKLCIFDLDNRPWDNDGQVFGKKPLSWDNAESIHGLSLGVVQHWVYAKIHGYDYYYVRTGEFRDRRASWKKPFVLRRMMEKYDTCVYMDSDAIFNHMDLPLEWLMNYWDINRETNSMALSIDPKAEHNKDKQGKLYDNTGFIITQNRPVTFEMLNDWAECADDGGKHPGCTEYRTVAFGRPSDQGGFGNYIRYDYKDEVKELPCSEANGFPEDHSECVGTFVKHLWSGKSDLIKIAIGQQIPGRFLEVFHKQLLAEKDQFFWTEADLMSEKWDKMPSHREFSSGDNSGAAEGSTAGESGSESEAGSSQAKAEEAVKAES